MPGSGTRTFLEPDHYEASLRQAQIEILIALSSKFKARLTWAELHDLQVFRCEEDFPRVAYVRLAPQLSFVTFPAHSGPLPVWGGTELRPGEIVLHGRGERLHQSTPGSFVWNVIALDPAQLEQYGSGSLRKAFHFAIGAKNPASLPARCGAPAAPACANLPPRRDQAQIIGAYGGRARHRAKFDPDAGRLSDRGQRASRRPDQTPSRPHHDQLRGGIGGASQQASAHDRFVRADWGDRARPCALVALEFLGMSPIRYVLLRRLSRARVALRDASSRRRKPPGACPRLRFRGARTFRGGLPGRPSARPR